MKKAAIAMVVATIALCLFGCSQGQNQDAQDPPSAQNVTSEETGTAKPAAGDFASERPTPESSGAEEPIVQDADGADAPGESTFADDTPNENIPADAQSPWLGTWYSDDGESLEVTAASASGISVIYNGWEESGASQFHSAYEMAFQDADGLQASTPASESWDYVLHLEGEYIRMESRYPDRYFYKESAAAQTAPFYGIWCSASKDPADAQVYADELARQGFDARVFVTTDWGNLNAEMWYVVTAGAYSTETAALEALPRVQQVQPDAYVKYSGNYQGA